MAEVEIAGAKIKGGKLMLLVPIVSALGGGLWGGFEFYKDYMDMKEIIQEIDVDTITAQNTLTQTKLDEAIDYTRDIKNNLREDIMTVETHVDKIRNEVQNAIDEMNQLQKDTLASMREVEALNRETEKDVRDTMRETESRIEEAMTKLEERLSMRLQEALDNPLVGN
jgi:predicted transcriptional regulator